MPTLSRMMSRTAITALGLLVLGACAKNDADDTGMASSDTSSVVQSPPAPPPINDGNILAGLAAGDSTDIMLGTAMQQQATNPELRKYGAMIVADHTQHLKDIEALAKQDSMTVALMSGDTSAQHRENVKTMFAGMTKGASTDSSFVETAINAHQAGLDRLDDFDGKTQNANVKALIAATKPVMQKHLDGAKAIKDKMDQ